MKVGRIKTGEWGKLRAFFDLEVGGFTIKGFKIVEGSNGLFVSMPSTKDKDGKYNDDVYCVKEIRQKLNHLATQHYKGVEGVDQDVEEQVEDNNQDENIPF